MREIRVNVLLLTLMGVVVVLVSANWLEPDKIAMLASGLIGAIGATMTKLVDPPEPEPEPTVPARTVEQVVAVLDKSVDARLATQSQEPLARKI